MRIATNSEQQAGAATVRPSKPASVDVWMLPITPLAVEENCLERQLDPGELLRANRFRKVEDRVRYVVAHVGLRWILSRIYGIDLEQQRFVRGPSGKPRLAPLPGRPDIRFNLSHSGSLVLIAASSDVEVGVDVELKDTAIDFGVLQVFCSDRELSRLALLPHRVRMDALYRLWTLKEALAKAQGSGLRRPLEQISVDFSLDRPTTAAHLSGDSQEWFAKELAVPSRYAAAVAFSGGPLTVRQFSASFSRGELDVADVRSL